MVLASAKHDNRVEAQTVREWLYEYESSHNKPVWPSSWGINARQGYIVVPDDYSPVFSNKEHTKPKCARVRI